MRSQDETEGICEKLIAWLFLEVGMCYNTLTNLQESKAFKSFGEHWRSNRSCCFASPLNNLTNLQEMEHFTNAVL